MRRRIGAASELATVVGIDGRCGKAASSLECSTVDRSRSQPCDGQQLKFGICCCWLVLHVVVPNPPFTPRDVMAPHGSFIPPDSLYLLGSISVLRPPKCKNRSMAKRNLSTKPRVLPVDRSKRLHKITHYAKSRSMLPRARRIGTCVHDLYRINVYGSC
ncbi:hypothetical protein M011DRAFT_471758 [Sporormia fimetaria CBS 119925]|uniref:Uncharacterized protein n=1 Tax=Sporormia fimetaria CBS 119925 TaxID=1340428 RepID=A0A6A6UZY9_9PLEO|nr:hypothetical protein M011DRAFT_471758 [Sporormia fimetaria CBS 119925]